MSTRIVEPQGWPRPSGYSNGVVGTGELLFVAGQIGWDEQRRIVSEDVVAQFRKALENVIAVVSAAGGSANDVARLTIYVTDRASWAGRSREIGEAYRAVMGDHYPAMALLVVAGLMEPAARVEVEATAAIQQRGKR